VKKVFLISLVLVLAMSLIAVGCAEEPEPEPESEWNIPTIIFLTGVFAGHGESFLWVVQQAAAEINAAGGIDGKSVNLEICDSALDPTKAVACMAKAIDRGALVTIGPIAEPEVKAAMPLAMEEGLFAFTMVSAESVTREFLPWNIWLGFGRETCKQYMMPMWVNCEPDITSMVGLVVGAFPSWVERWEDFQESFPGLNVSSKGMVDIPLGAIDFGPSAISAIGTGADAFCLVTTEEIAAKLVIELVNRGVDPTRIFVHFTAMGSVFMTETEGYNEGVYCEISLTHEFTPEWADLNMRFAGEHGGALMPPALYCIHDALYMIKEAIENEGITGDPAKLAEERIKLRDYVLNQEDFDGIKFTYDVVDGIAATPVYMFQIQDGEAVYVDHREP